MDLAAAAGGRPRNPRDSQKSANLWSAKGKMEQLTYVGRSRGDPAAS